MELYILHFIKEMYLLTDVNPPVLFTTRIFPSMDIEGGFNQHDSEGFIKINAIRLMAHRAIIEENQKK